MHQLQPGQYGIIEENSRSKGEIVARIMCAYDWVKCVSISHPDHTWETKVGSPGGIGIRVRVLPPASKILVVTGVSAGLMVFKKPRKKKAKK
jgi:hypothetical protein